MKIFLVSILFLFLPIVLFAQVPDHWVTKSSVGFTPRIYHTANEKQIVGVAQVTSNAYPNPKETDERIVVVDLKPKSKLKSPVTLETIKSDPAFKDWELVRISRLGVMPVSDAIWKRLEKLSNAM
jgi:predicted RNA-binding protein with PUA-like domain